MTTHSPSRSLPKRWLALLAAVVALAMFATACGSGSSSESTTDEDTTETTDDAGSDDAGTDADADSEADAEEAGGEDEGDAEPADDAENDESAEGDASAGDDAEAAASGDEVVLKFARFFGDCEEDVAGVTDVSQATTECEVIQIIENAFNAEDNGVRVEKIGGQAWDDYYTQLSTAFAGGEIPNVAVMHQHRLPDYAGRDLLMALDDQFEQSSVIDFADYTAPAQEAAKYNDTIYALPFDIHGSLWHVNIDIMEEAGLVDAEGNPQMATSPDELLAQCEAIKALDKQCFGHDWFEFGVGARLFLGLVQQQGGTLTDADGMATPNTAEGKASLEFLNQLAEYSNTQQGYTDSQAAFLSGDIAMLHNGTWVVDQYNNEAPFTYMATNVPTLYDTASVWGDSHMWIMPQASNEDPEMAAASMKFMEYLYDNVGNWAKGTGHIAPRTSVLDSAEIQDAPQRANYAETASIAGLVPAVEGWAGAWDALAEELDATWVSGKDQAGALDDAAARMNEELGN